MKLMKSCRKAMVLLLLIPMLVLAASCGQATMAGLMPEEKSAGELPTDAVPTDAQNDDQALTCTLSVSCKALTEHNQSFSRDKVDLVPADGVLFAAREVEFYAGENVFQVLRRELKQAKMHMEFVRTPLHDSVYIEGIHNIYEFDCGELSGWMYKVNEEFPSYSSGQYLLADGDVVEWMFTCDLGRDIGGEGGFWARGES